MYPLIFSAIKGEVVDVDYSGDADQYWGSVENTVKILKDYSV